MPYYCKIHKIIHSGWPHVQNCKPEEFLHIDNEKRDKSVCGPGYVIIPAHNTNHYYLPACWQQKVANSEYIWNLIVWVMVNEDTFLQYRCGKLNEFVATLQNVILWYGTKILGLPLCIEKHDNELYIVDINVNSNIRDEYHDGMPYSLAVEWADNIVEQIEMDCFEAE